MTTKIFTGLTLLGASLYVDAVEANTKPDVLFIFTDDQTFDALNALGNKELITPNLDKLVESGTTFTNTYIMGGWHGAISVASRSQLITGRYLWNSYEDSKRNNYGLNIKQKTMWPQVMRKAGYRTFLTGKWHVWADASQLFDETNTVRAGMPNQNDKGYDRPVEGVEDKWSAWNPKLGGYWSDDNDKHWSENQADIAIDFIQRYKDSEKPLFIYCAFNAPHDPRQSPKEYVDMYDPEKIAVPENYIAQHPLMKELGMIKNDKLLRDERLVPYPRTEYAVKRNIQEYYAIITHLDAQIGRLIEELKTSGRYENTIIVFGADNGLAMGHHGLMGKQNMYEHSVKVPLLFVGEGIPQGETRDQLVYLQDLVPTIYEMIGAQAPANMEFKSQLGALKSNEAEGRESVYSAYMTHQRMVRKGDYKLFFIVDAKEVYLFDLKKDPNEMNNLYGDPKYDKIVEELGAEYLLLAKEAGDTMDITKIYPAIF